MLLLSEDADPEEVVRALARLGAWGRVLVDEETGSASVTLGDGSVPLERDVLARLPGVSAVLDAPSGHPRVDAFAGPVRAGPLLLGGDRPALIAGPCSVESPERIDAIAAAVAAAGGTGLRGSAFKPRTSPYSFRGVGAEALGWLRAAADAHGLAVVSEVVSVEHVDAVAGVADLVQVGARSMHDAALLQAAGAAGRPVLLKRGLSATVREWLLAAEALLLAGAPGVVLCERGVRSFDRETRNLLDVGAIALLAQQSAL
jgi:3-deoxy-7-phosphoheptulonate synthase